jgi:hypothetical protein
MDEYISKHEVIDYLNGYLHSIGDTHALFDRGQRRALINAIQDISAVKSADVQPIRRGRWIETHISLCKWFPEDEKEEGHSFYMAEMKCSCCERYNTVTFALTLNKPDFCQLCGARMIKDGDAE